MGRIILVTGGARSGKSAFAEELAGSGNVVCVATGEECDEEMAERIARHRRRRPAGWITIETRLELGKALAAAPSGASAVLVDCLATWTSNYLILLDESEGAGWLRRVAELEERLTEELLACIRTAREAAWDLILVTNEVGYGVVPPTPLGRVFRDMLGRINRAAAAEADSVFMVVAGMAVDWKRLAATQERGAASQRPEEGGK
jgi:adenosylcobinamide kinase/adenosylcobinamide-phosphate guanylyltransferase